MKQYQKHYQKAILERHRSLLLGKSTTQEPSDTVAGSFVVNVGGAEPATLTTGGSTKTHVLTLQSPLLEKKDDFLEISFKEWSQWLAKQELINAQLRLKYSTHYTPIDFP